MKVISFRIQGKMAHFRKYYTNSSALSYTVPPRTTIIGMIAGLLGLERDSYYDLFSLDRCKIALANLAPVKKIVQKLNLLHVESKEDLNGSKGHPSQTPTEIVIPENIRTGLIEYQVWISCSDSMMMEQIHAVLSQAQLEYLSLGGAFALGTVQHLGSVRYVGCWEGEEREESGKRWIHSLLPKRHVERIHAEEGEGLRLIKEELPLEFDGERHLTERGKGDFIINLQPTPVPATVKKFVRLENDIHLMWME